MENREEARRLLDVARKDLNALPGMMDVETFADEIFGFHAQQATEKALKAWLTFLLLSKDQIMHFKTLNFRSKCGLLGLFSQSQSQS